MIKLDEATLLAYVDGKLDADTARAVEAALTRDAEARALVEKLRATPDSLREVFDATLTRPLPPRFAQTILRGEVGEEPNLRIRKSYALVVMLAVIMIGAGTGYIAGFYERESRLITGEQSWISAVVDYQVLYGRETLSHPTATRDEISRYEKRFSDRLGHDVIVPDLQALGLVFKRGQILEFNGLPVVQLAYLPTTGRPIAYCIMRDEGADTVPALGRAKGLTYYHWRESGHGHIVVGPVSDEQLRQLLPVVRGVRQRDT